MAMTAPAPSSPPDPDDTATGLPARRAAMRLLEAVLIKGETLEKAGAYCLSALKGPVDKAHAKAIAGESLRWLVDLDALIDGATKKPLDRHAKTRSVLRIMLAQALRLETPPHAVIASALPLLTGGQRRLAHGVFSALLKRNAALPLVPTLPENVQARWGERAAAIAAGLASPPPLDLQLKDAGETQERAESMGAVSLAPGHLRLPRGTPVDRLPSYEEGAWWVQDLAASLPASLLGRGEGKRVLDLCAAPGGKTLQLAAAGWQVTALDINERRLERLRENLQRTGLEAEIVVADALAYTPGKAFDAILLDAPCTATGTCRRHPDVLHRIGEDELAETTTLQAALLRRAVGWLPEGGTLVYAVCSLEDEEGAGQAARVALEPVPIGAAELPAGLQPTPEGWLRTDPGMLAEHGGLDGFFVARWKK